MEQSHARLNMQCSSNAIELETIQSRITQSSSFKTVTGETERKVEQERENWHKAKANKQTNKCSKLKTTSIP